VAECEAVRQLYSICGVCSVAVIGARRANLGSVLNNDDVYLINTPTNAHICI